MAPLEILTAAVALIWIDALILARWRRGLYFLVAYLPFAGAVILATHLWWPSLLFKDFIFVIPLYVAFFSRTMLHRETLAGFPSSIAYLMVCLAALAAVQAGNSHVANMTMALIGIKVWLFYLPICLVAYAFADSAERIITLFRLIVALSFAPATVALMQLALARHLGYHAAMQMSYGTAAFQVTQGYSQFHVEQGGFGRIPSLFTFPAQYFGYSLTVLPPSYVLLRADPSLHWRRAGVLALVLAAVGTCISGAREAYIFAPLTLGLMLILDRGLSGLFMGVVALPLLMWTAVTVIAGTAVWAMYGLVFDLLSHYTSAVAYGGIVKALQTAPLGMGTGTNTGPARYAVGDPSTFIGIENYYAKTIVELGVPGLLIVAGLFLAIMFVGFRTRQKIADPGLRNCSSALLAFTVIMFLNSFKGWQIDLDPVNVYYWLFAGILLKLWILDNDMLETGYAAEDIQNYVSLHSHASGDRNLSAITRERVAYGRRGKR